MADQSIYGKSASEAAPTLLISGLQDDQTENASSNGFAFAHLLPNVKNKRLIVTNGGHPAAKLAPVAAETIRWFDHWLKGIDNGVDKEAVTVFWETQIPGVDFSKHYQISPEESSRAVPAWTSTYADWPIPNLKHIAFYLTGDAKLSTSISQSERKERKYLYPAGTELVGSNLQFALVPTPRGSLQYRTDPMADDMTLLGNPAIDLYFSAALTDTDFMLTLKDIAPDGRTTYLTRGFLRAPLREVDEARSKPDRIIQSFRKQEKLQPGEINEARFSLQQVGHVVRKGHRIELRFGRRLCAAASGISLVVRAIRRIGIGAVD
ncbi:CocE/NonD family hydrolase [Bradyrhizobium sp. USDA 4011]